MKRFVVIVAAFVFAWSCGLVRAQDFPNAPIRLVVGFPPGSTADISARVIGTKMGSILGQSFVIENRVGAGSSLAAAQVARSPKDGYTLYLSSIANVLNVAMNQPLTFDYYNDFVPIALVTSTPTVLVVNPEVGVKNVRELVAYARENPEKLLFGGVGNAINHVLQLFNAMAGIKITYVPYPGSPQVVTDLLAGRIHGYFSPASTVAGQVAAGKLVALAVTEAERSPFFPDLPTMQEAGVPGCVAVLWFGIQAPAGTPKEVVDKLTQAANQALKADDVVQALRAQTVSILGGTPESFSKHIENERKLWNGVVESAGLKR